MVFTNREVPVSAAGEHKRVMEKMPHVAEQVSSVVLRANGGKPPVLSVEQSFSGSLCADQLTAKGVSCCRSEITIECVEDRFPNPSQERTRKEERNPNKTRNPSSWGTEPRGVGRALLLLFSLPEAAGKIHR